MKGSFVDRVNVCAGDPRRRGNKRGTKLLLMVIEYMTHNVGVQRNMRWRSCHASIVFSLEAAGSPNSISLARLAQEAAPQDRKVLSGFVCLIVKLPLCSVAENTGGALFSGIGTPALMSCQDGLAGMSVAAIGERSF